MKNKIKTMGAVLDPSGSLWKKEWTVLAIVLVLLLYLYARPLVKTFTKYAKGDLGIQESSHVDLRLYRHTIKSHWEKHNNIWSKHAKLQARGMGQIDGQLYGACNCAGQPFRPEGEEQCCNIELVGNIVMIHDQEKPHVSMYTHPQDTILDIMQKFDISPKDVLVHSGERLEDLDKTLMEYGIRDNWKVDLLVEEQSLEPTKLVALKDAEVEELFQNI
jgi:hypothetical protein